MATLTRTNSRINNPMYKDYMNFVASYKNGKRENANPDSGIAVRNFPLSNSSTSTSSSSLSSDVPDFSKNICTPYNTFLENSKNKKFGSVKLNCDEKNEQNCEEKVQQNCEEEKKEKTMKSEIYIEIQPAKSVSEVSKMFENKQDRKSPPKSTNQINSRISIFEKQISTENKPKLANKPVLNRSPPPPKIDIYKDASQPPKIDIYKDASQPPPPPPQDNIKRKHILPPKVDIYETSQVEVTTADVNSVPQPPPMPSETNGIGTTPPAVPVHDVRNHAPAGSPPPPPPPSQPAKLQATLVRGPQTKYQIHNPNGVVLGEIDRNDPMVKKLVYGTLRGLYGAYHDKASDMLATLPKNMVVRSNGVQDRIEQIAANGDLDKLNGRVNPKKDQE